jgi:hypothetical protein
MELASQDSSHPALWPGRWLTEHHGVGATVFARLNLIAKIDDPFTAFILTCLVVVVTPLLGFSGWTGLWEYAFAGGTVSSVIPNSTSSARIHKSTPFTFVLMTLLLRVILFIVRSFT